METNRIYKADQLAKQLNSTQKFDIEPYNHVVFIDEPARQMVIAISFIWDTRKITSICSYAYEDIEDDLNKQVTDDCLAIDNGYALIAVNEDQRRFLDYIKYCNETITMNQHDYMLVQATAKTKAKHTIYCNGIKLVVLDLDEQQSVFKMAWQMQNLHKLFGICIDDEKFARYTTDYGIPATSIDAKLCFIIQSMLKRMYDIKVQIA